jgi:hypothetical protein
MYSGPDRNARTRFDMTLISDIFRINYRGTRKTKLMIVAMTIALAGCQTSA